MYAALDPRLREALEAVGLRYPDDVDPVDQLRQAAEGRRAEPGRPAIHLLHLAFGIMAMFAARGDEPAARLVPVARELLDERRDDKERDARILMNDLARAAGVALEDRWAQVRRADDTRGEPLLHPDLRRIDRAWCRPELRSVGDEIVSRVETMLVVTDPRRDLDSLARAVLPENWPRCNDFFCDLIRREDRDDGCPGTTGGALGVDVSHWRGVYEERVGECPAGWFPDTFLAMTWDRTPSQIILRYELVPRRAGDRPALRIDEGYLQVDRIGDTYHVSTVKYLLFDDAVIPGGGQTLGQAACQLGWLDYSVNQFTDCADHLGDPSGTTTSAESGGRGGIDAGIQEVLDRCQVHLLETAHEADARSRRTARRIRAGEYGLDDYVADWTAAARSGVRDGARSVQGQLDLARAWGKVAGVFARPRGGRR